MLRSSVRLSSSSRSKSAAPSKIGADPFWPVITGKRVTWTRSTRPAAISARLSDRLPCERSGTSDSSLSRATTSTASHARKPRVTHFGVLGARGQHPHEGSECVGAEDHPLLLAVEGKAVLEQLGALLAPVAGPVAAGGAVTVEAGEYVEDVGRGHVVGTTPPAGTHRSQYSMPR